MHGTEIPPALLSSVQEEHRKIAESGKMLRYHQLSAVHNPWGRAATIFDSWKLLDVCQSPCLLELVSEMIGKDIFLWDSRFFSLADFVPKDAWICESDFSPFENIEGVTVRIPVSPLDLEIAVCHDVHLPYRYANTDTGAHHGEYVIQYASGYSRFVRDQSSAVLRSLADRLPLINYGEAPIWLLQGVDYMNNDFAAGFAPTVAQWTDAKW